MWGTRETRNLFQPFRRFIPTHVGNSESICQAMTISTVHPHACGELFCGFRAIISPTGSSPRMWGTLEHPDPGFADVRFIPTHVGNSNHDFRSHKSVAVHPHACGELNTYIKSWILQAWFIPTHVGNSLLELLPYCYSPVHPHACGELQRGLI